MMTLKPIRALAKISGLTLLILASCMTSYAALAGVYELRFSGLAAPVGQDCDGNAFQLGQKLASMYPVRVVEAFCSAGELESIPTAVVIRYEAPQPLNRISTFDYATAIAGIQTYKTEALCNEALRNEIPYFTAKTGLQPFLNYCQPPNSPYSSNGNWGLGIVAFGQAAIRPYVGATYVYGKIFGMDDAGFGALLKDGFAALGADMVQWTTDSHMSHGTLNVRYYGRSKIRFQELILAKLHSAEECLTQRDAVASAVSGATGASLGTFCHQLTGVGRDIELVTFATEGSRLRVVRAEGTSSQFSDCKGRVAAIVERYRNELRRPILAGYCGWNRDVKAYEVHLLEKPNA